MALTVSLCIAGPKSTGEGLAAKAKELFADVTRVGQLTAESIRNVQDNSKGSWLLFLQTGEDLNLAFFRGWMKQKPKGKTWGFALPVQYFNTPDRFASPDRHWEVRLVKKDCGYLTGYGLSYGVPGEKGVAFLDGVEIRNPDHNGQKIASSKAAPGPLKQYLALQKNAADGKISGDAAPWLQVLSKLQSMSYFHAAAYLLTAKSFLAAGETLQAENILLEGLQKFPQYTDLFYLLGELKMFVGNQREAIVCFQQAISVNPVHYPGYLGANAFRAAFGLGKAFEGILDITKAVECYREAYRPEFNEPLYTLGKILVANAGVPAAQRELESIVIKYGELDAEVMADVFYTSNCYETCLEYLERVPTNSSTAFFRGTVLARLRRWREAVESFELVEQSHDLYGRSRLQICFCLWAQNKPLPAERILENFPNKSDLEFRQYATVNSLLRKKPLGEGIENCDWQVALGILNRFMEINSAGKARKISAFLEKVMQQPIQLTLSRIYQYHKNFPKVIDCLKRFEQLGEMTEETYRSLAEAYLHTGKLAKAFQVLNRQVIEGKARVETFVLASRVLALQSIKTLQTGSKKLNSPVLAQRAEALASIINCQGSERVVAEETPD